MAVLTSRIQRFFHLFLKYHKWKNCLFPTKASASLQANKVCQLGQDVCSAGNTFEKIAEGCRWELKARNSAVQLCAVSLLRKTTIDLYTLSLFKNRKSKAQCDLNIKILNNDSTRICGVMCILCENVYVFELLVLFLTHNKFCSHYWRYNWDFVVKRLWLLVFGS